MASSLLETPTGTQRSSKASKLNRRNVLPRGTTQVNLGFMKLLCFSVAFDVPILYCWVVLRHFCTNGAH